MYSGSSLERQMRVANGEELSAVSGLLSTFSTALR